MRQHICSGKRNRVKDQVPEGSQVESGIVVPYNGKTAIINWTKGVGESLLVVWTDNCNFLYGFNNSQHMSSRSEAFASSTTESVRKRSEA